MFSPILYIPKSKSIVVLCEANTGYNPRHYSLTDFKEISASNFESVHCSATINTFKIRTSRKFNKIQPKNKWRKFDVWILFQVFCTLEIVRNHERAVRPQRKLFRSRLLKTKRVLWVLTNVYLFLLNEMNAKTSTPWNAFDDCQRVERRQNATEWKAP